MEHALGMQPRPEGAFPWLWRRPTYQCGRRWAEEPEPWTGNRSFIFSSPLVSHFAQNASFASLGPQSACCVGYSYMKGDLDSLTRSCHKTALSFFPQDNLAVSLENPYSPPNSSPGRFSLAFHLQSQGKLTWGRG